MKIDMFTHQLLQYGAEHHPDFLYVLGQVHVDNRYFFQSFKRCPSLSSLVIKMQVLCKRT